MESQLHLQGNLVADPTQRVVASGSKVTRFRLASRGRRFDKGLGEWVDTDPVYMSVACWRQLGDNVAKTLHKGDTVIVVGRLTMREYDDANGGPRRSFYEIDATSVGPDLSRYVALLARPNRELSDAEVPAQSAETDGVVGRDGMTNHMEAAAAAA
jgi:single-strand DNA-binding protein